MSAPLATFGNPSPAESSCKPAIAKIDDALEEEQRVRIWNFLSVPGWKFGWKSDPKKDPYSFWHKHFAGNRLPDHYAKNGKERSYDCADELLHTAPLLHELWTDLEKK